MDLIAKSHGSGSPGPLDRNIPSGLNDIISSEVVFAGTTSTLQFILLKIRNIFFFTPKS